MKKFDVKSYLAEDQGLEDINSVDAAVTNAATAYLEPQEQVSEAPSRSVLSEAVLRMEQANLYKTILDHSIFAEGSARPEILQMVESEFKSFAEDRLSTLLGMKEPTKAQVQIFTDSEVQVLKSFAGKIVDKVAPSTQAAYVPPKPIVTKIGAPKAQPALAQPIQSSAKPQPRQVAPTVAAPETPKPAKKPVRGGRSPHAKPMPSVNVEEMKYAQETASIGSIQGQLTSAAVRSASNANDYLD